jgi:hypothetical protein
MRRSLASPDAFGLRLRRLCSSICLELARLPHMAFRVMQSLRDFNTKLQQWQRTRLQKTPVCVEKIMVPFDRTSWEILQAAIILVWQQRDLPRSHRQHVHYTLRIHATHACALVHGLKGHSDCVGLLWARSMACACA